MAKIKAWEKYSKFSAAFLTTYHREFNNDEIALENRNSDSLETGNDDLSPKTDSKVIIAGVMGLDDFKYKVSYDNLNIFLDNISKMTIRKHNAKALVYMHGLNYHGSYILAFLLKNGYQQTLQTNFFGSADIRYKEFAMLSCSSKIFHIILYWNGVLIKFIDSLKIMPKELGNLAQEINLKEIDVDYTKFTYLEDHNYDKTWLDSLERKCLIIAKWMKSFHKYEIKSTNLNNETIGCIAYDYVRQKMKEKIPDFKISDYVRWQPWMIGAISFPSLKEWGKWVYKPNCIDAIDMNSGYASVMAGLLPFGKSKLKPDKKWKTYCCYYKIKVIDAIIKKKYNTTAFMWRAFEYDKNGKKKFYLEKNIDINYNHVQRARNKIYYVIDKELDIWKETYDIKYKVLEKHYFQTENYLEAIIRKHYKFHDKKAKSILVNIFGKFAQKWNKEQDFYGKKERIDTKKYDIIGKKQTFYEAYRISKKRETWEKAKPIYLAAYITASIRVTLIKKIKEIIDKGGIFLYDDTDMVTFVNDPAKNIVFNDIGEQLGQWKYEFKGADAFCCLCPKQYRVVKDNKVIKFATAGINRDAMAAVKNQDYDYDLGDNDKYKIVKNHIINTENGKIIVNQSYNFKKWKELKSNPICPKELYQ